jgi:hypothetical protein
VAGALRTVTGNRHYRLPAVEISYVSVSSDPHFELVKVLSSSKDGLFDLIPGWDPVIRESISGSTGIDRFCILQPADIRRSVLTRNIHRD